jgi:AcrR family transcriptional regulator
MPKVSPEHKEAVRRRIMDAALRCLERNRYQGFTTRQLLAEVGLSIGTFYNYFPSKEHLYEALAEETLSAEIHLALTEGGEQQGVGRALIALLREAMSNPLGSSAVAAFRSQMSDPGAGEPVDRLNRYMIDELAPLVKEAQSEGWIRDDLDPLALTELFDIIWDGLGRRESTATMQTSYQRVGEVVVALFLEGLVGEAARADQAGRSAG